MTFTDTHCHIHEEDYPEAEGAYQRAMEAGVTRLLVVGTDLKSSREAMQFASTHANAWAVVGVHPHETAREGAQLGELRGMIEGRSETRVTSHEARQGEGSVTGRIVGIGEIGLDYYYTHSPREVQIQALEEQLQLARDYDLPVSFHVREAFDDFWPILDNFPGVRGVLHSFTDSPKTLEVALSRNLYIGVNGIATFARDKQDLYRAIPTDKMLLETDAPYLTPVPHRGKVNEPALLEHVAGHIANLQSINLQELSRATEASATHLFTLK
ncbi:MAG: TatD family hydrolase [Candidatus Saccharimonadales bacterium]